MANGRVTIAAEIDASGYVRVLIGSQLRKNTYGKRVADWRRFDRQRVGNNLGEEKHQPGVQVACQVTGGLKRRLGSFDVGEDDVERKVRILIACRRRNGDWCYRLDPGHDFERSRVPIKAVSNSTGGI